MLKFLLTAALLAPAFGSASDLLGPIQHLQGRHIGDADPITWTIEYYDGWGRTFVDENGGHFYHDRCCGGFRTNDPSWVYAPQYWGQYVMYYIGTTMRYRIRLTNNGPRNYSNLRVVAIQEYLTQDGSWGEWLCPGAAKDWYLPSLDAGQTVVLESSMYIPWGESHGGLDQTHLQVQHWNRGEGQPGAGSVILDDTHAAIWCPPEAGAPGAQSIVPGAAASPTAVAVIRVTPSSGGTITARIYDRSGTLVRTITTDADGTATTVSWDGRDQAGAGVAPGAYLVLVDGPGVRLREKVAVVR